MIYFLLGIYAAVSTYFAYFTYRMARERGKSVLCSIELSWATWVSWWLLLVLFEIFDYLANSNKKAGE